MSKLLKRCYDLSNHLCLSTRRLSSSIAALRDSNIVQENDIVLLKLVRGSSPSKSGSKDYLTPPLASGTFLKNKGWANFGADDIIGKRYGDRVAVRQGHGKLCLISKPTLEDYVIQAQRLVTPIYPSTCNLIVSLLDLHPTVPHSGKDRERLEIFEAGTGHGALTLHLARAIHGANTAAPEIPPSFERKLHHLDGAQHASGPSDDKELEAHPNLHLSPEASQEQEAYDQWRESRRAVIHTLDRSSQFSKHAQKLIRNFHGGMYLPHINFHIGSISRYLNKRLTESEDSVFNHAILDLPSPDQYLSEICKALKVGGTLIVFSPSISTLLACLTSVKQHQVPLWLEKTLEVGAGLAHGGREWDVRFVNPRKPKLESEGLVQHEGFAKATSDDNHPSESSTESEEPVNMNEMQIVCKPKIGIAITAGAFLSVWRKMSTAA